MSKKYNAQSTIDDILSVSAKLFLEKGFNKTSMNDIAKAAGISKGAIYHHFQSKNEIINIVSKKQAQLIKETMENWLSEISTLNGKEQLQALLEKNLDSQEAHYLDDIMCSRMKSAEFVLSYMQDCVNNDSHLVSKIIQEGIDDGSLSTDFPDEAAEVFLLLLNVWCDSAIFNCNIEKLSMRLRFIQHMMKSIGIDVLTDTLIQQSTDLLEKIYFQGEQNI